MKSQALAFWVGFFLFAVYLLTFSTKLYVMDELFNFTVSHNLAQYGRADVNQLIWTMHWHAPPPGIWGQDNNLYTKKAPGTSLAAAPFIWLGHQIPGLNPVPMSNLVSLLATALTGSLLLIWLGDLGISRFVAVLTTLAYGLGTVAWVYARLLWEHALMAFFFLVMMWSLYRLIYLPGGRSWVWVLLCGVAVAGSVMTRFEALPVVGLVGLYLFYYAAPRRGGLSIRAFAGNLCDGVRWRWLAIYLIPSILALAWLLYFNYSRYGSISETGYNQEALFQRPWEGTFGLLFSPSTGLFIYSPLMLLLFLGLRPAWRRRPRPYLWLLAGLSLFYWIFYGSWFSWGSTWVWGPRFLLHTLPLLMLFVAEALEHYTFIRPVALLLALIGFIFNLLGIVVDLNEHFLRLGRNDNFLFNWAAFPPLGHWRILQEGLVDLAWLRPQAGGLQVDWAILGPAAVLFAIALVGLLITMNNEQLEISNEKLARPGLAGEITNTPRATHYASRITHYVLRFTFYASPPATFSLLLLLTILLTYQMMLGLARAKLETEQAQLDEPALQRLAESVRPGDALLASMPPFGDVQEVTTYLMSYLDQPIPTYAWIESEPRAIQPEERERIWRVVQAEASRVWLFERWLSQKDPLGLTAARFNREAFPVEEYWFERSGRLTLYALSNGVAPTISAPLDAPFQGGLKLVDFAVFGDTVAPGAILKVRLTWRAEALDPARLPEARVIGFVHLVGETSGGNLAQQDRLLVDLQAIKQSALLPGQTVTQGYGLRLPEDTPPGSYPLVAGLYLAASGERLQRADGSPDDFLYLTNITVGRGE
jgi:hypothetical protein